MLNMQKMLQYGRIFHPSSMDIESILFCSGVFYSMLFFLLFFSKSIPFCPIFNYSTVIYLISYFLKRMVKSTDDLRNNTHTGNKNALSN